MNINELFNHDYHMITFNDRTDLIVLSQYKIFSFNFYWI